MEPTFALTPRNSYFAGNDAGTQVARLWIYGGDFNTEDNPQMAYSYRRQYEQDKVMFAGGFGAPPGVDYSQWQNRIQTRYIQFHYNLTSLGANKQLALIFGFEAHSGRIQIFTAAGQIGDQMLDRDDSQFLLVSETLESTFLYFIHTGFEGSPYGGTWFFKGITGYVV